MLFDTHCHLDATAFDADRQQVLQAARMVGVKSFLVPATQRSGWKKVLDLCAKEAHLYPAFGLHPVFSHVHVARDLSLLAIWVARYQPVAIGEIGLDYFDRSLTRSRQQVFFEAQLAIAQLHQLPVVLHVRKAHDAVLNTLRQFCLPGGFCHAFNGSLQQAEQYQSMGFKLGFGGMLTYPNARKLRQLAQTLPLSSIVLETDAPDMSGIRHRYQRNSPAYLFEVAEVLAQLHRVSVAEVALQTTHNAFEIIHAKKWGSAAPIR